MTLHINVFKGNKILPYLQVLADMRLKAFCEFPYLYVGNREDELAYAKEYALIPQGLLVVAFKNEHVAGFYSGMPLNSPGTSLQHWCKKLRKLGIDVDTSYYAGELIIDPAFQKQKCCSLLITRFIEEVKSMKFPRILGVTCAREKDHPLCPPNYFGSDSLWRKIGAEKTNIILSARWPTRQIDGSLKEEKNKLECWIKNMDPERQIKNEKWLSDEEVQSLMR